MTAGFVGALSLSLTLLFSVLGLVFCVLAYNLRDGRYLESARKSAWVVMLGGVASFASLEWAIQVHDFSVLFVAKHHSVLDPTWVRWVTPWSALEGSILLWAMLQGIYLWLVSLQISVKPNQSNGRVRLDMWRAPIALGTLFLITSFFFGVMVLVTNPFGVVPFPPADGMGPNPLLQNHWMMAVHPVLMYLGFVGLSVPFAYAASAMITGRFQSWVAETRWWTLVAWGFLTAAIFAGGWWSYEVLGWGGYWAWDPVENASIIPWFLATAFLHTAQVQERKGLFRGWNFGFIILAFAGTVFGTFLTRSGVIQSVHAFGDGPVGMVFLAFLLLILGVGLGLLSRVNSRLRESGEIRWTSREGALLAGALLFGSMAFVVILGTLWPLVLEATTGAKVSIGAPFFNQVIAPLGIATLLLMGIGPVLPWRKTTAEIKSNLLMMLIALVVGFVFALLMGWKLSVCLVVALFVYNVVSVLLMIARGVIDRRTAHKESPFFSLYRLAGLNRRRFGSHVVHVGVALAGLALAFSGGYRQEAQKTLKLGERWDTMGLSILLKDVSSREEANRSAVVASLGVLQVGPGGLRELGSFSPKMNFYRKSPSSPLPSPAVKYTALNDYYFVLQQFDTEEGSWATIRLIVTPMVLWLWVAGVIIVLGTAFSLWPAALPKGAD